MHDSQYLVGQVAQPALLNALGSRINGGQRVVDRGILILAQNAVFGMNHLETGCAFAGLAEAGQAHAVLELRHLLPGKVKEAQGELAGAVADAHQQVAPATIDGFGKQYLARNKAPVTSLQRTYLDQLRAVLVAQRQQEQQVFEPEEIQSLEFFRQRRSDAVQYG